MTTEVKIPSMGESITSGILSTWHVQDGEIVTQGQVIFELETDKISSEGTAEVGGKISLKVEADEEVEIDQVVATIDESVAAPAPSNAAKPDAPAAEASAAEGQSPAVRRLATETGVDPASVTGTGKDGRVTKGDMLGAGKQPSAPAAKEKAPKAKETISPETRTTTKKMTPLRRKIAERLVASQHESASLTTFNEADMSPIMNLRKKYQEEFVAKHGIKLGFMSFFVKAVVKALQEVPGINSQIEGANIIQNHFYDIGVAVGGPKGLMVPVIRNCDQLGFHDIELAISSVAKRAREGKIGVEDLEGGVFTITNGGIYGSLQSTPILNPPQSGILGMHSIKERPVVVDKEIVIRPMMNLALTYDHRVVDGKEAVTFLVKVKDALEEPTKMLLAI